MVEQSVIALIGLARARDSLKVLTATWQRMRLKRRQHGHGCR
jgi:hypothetical protein